MRLLVTPRLLLRPFTDGSELDEYFDLFASALLPSAMEQLNAVAEAPQISAMRAERALRLEELSRHLDTFGFGILAVIERREKRLIGRCGIVRIDDSPEIALDFAFAADTRGKGYAAEAATEVLRFAFVEKNIDRIVAYSPSENRVVAAILEKLGMKRIAAPDDERGIKFEKQNDLRTLRNTTPNKMYFVSSYLRG